MTDETLHELAQTTGLTLTEDNYSQARQSLINHINRLVENDFQQLIAILYRMDISENKLRALLSENPGIDAGLIITDLMIERQAQKIKSRQENRQQNNNISEEEKW